MTKVANLIMHLDIDIYEDIDGHLSCDISSDNSTGITYPLNYNWPLSRCITSYMHTIVEEEDKNKEKQDDIVVK